MSPTPRTDALARELERIKASDWKIDLLAHAQDLERELIEATAKISEETKLKTEAIEAADRIRGAYNDFVEVAKARDRSRDSAIRQGREAAEERDRLREYAGKLEQALKEIKLRAMGYRPNEANMRTIWDLADAALGPIPALPTTGENQCSSSTTTPTPSKTTCPTTSCAPASTSGECSPSGGEYEIDTQLAEAKRLNDDWFRANAPGGWIDNLRCSLNAAHAEIRALRAAAEVGTPRTSTHSGEPK